MIKYSVLVKFEHQIDGKETWLTAFTGVNQVTAAMIHRREVEKGRHALLVEHDRDGDAS
jgi:hypothetical protein